MFDVVGIGAHSVDHVYRLPGRPAFDGIHSKLRIRGQAVSVGGQAATALATCVSLGRTAAYAGAVGTDTNGDLVLAALSARGVDVAHAVRHDGGSQSAVILVDDATGERVVLWDRPDSLALNDDELPDALLRTARAVLVDDVDPRASLVAAERARAAGVAVVTDLDHVTPFTRSIVEAASHPILTEPLARALTGHDDLERALRQLRTWNAGLVTVTRGDRGAVALDGDRYLQVEAFRVDAVDTTGSGDVFRGAFIAALLRGLPTLDMLRFANAAAAVSCTRPGALDGVPTAGETEACLRG